MSMYLQEQVMFHFLNLFYRMNCPKWKGSDDCKAGFVKDKQRYS